MGKATRCGIRKKDILRRRTAGLKVQKIYTSRANKPLSNLGMYRQISFVTTSRCIQWNLNNGFYVRKPSNIFFISTPTTGKSVYRRSKTTIYFARIRIKLRNFFTGFRERCKKKYTPSSSKHGIVCELNKNCKLII